MGGSPEGNRPSMKTLLPEALQIVGMAVRRMLPHPPSTRELPIPKEGQIVPLTFECERKRLMGVKNQTIYDLTALHQIEQIIMVHK